MSSSCVTCAVPSRVPTTASFHERQRACGDGNEVIELFSARRFDFGSVQGSSSTEFIIAEQVDVSWASEARLHVRAHAATIGSGAKIEILIFAVSPSAEDPSRNFAVLTPTVAVEVPHDFTLPDDRLRGAAIPGELGSHLAVAVKGTQPAGGGDCNAVISAELVLKRRPDQRGGRKISVLPRTNLDYSELGSSAQQTTDLIRALDVRDYRSGAISLRVLERWIDSNAFLDVSVLSVAPSAEEPDVDFVDDQNAGAEMRIDAGTTPLLHVARLAPGFGPCLLVRVKATQSSSGGALAAAIEMDFVGQE